MTFEMANLDYINTRVELNNMSNSEQYDSRASVASIFSEPDSEFDILDDYINLSEDVSYSNQGVVHDQTRSLNDRGGPLIYANEAMLENDRDSVAPPVPRRTRKGNKKGISTMASSIGHEVHGWSRVKTAAIILISFVIGAAVVLATLYAKKIIDAISKGKAETNGENGHGGDNTCKIVTNLNGCKNTVYEKDIKGRSDHFSTNCSKVYKKIINSRLYIFYEDGISFSKAVVRNKKCKFPVGGAKLDTIVSYGEVMT